LRTIYSSTGKLEDRDKTVSLIPLNRLIETTA